MAKTKKPNPQDATLRNIRALKKRVAALEETVKALTATVTELERCQAERT